MLNDSILKAWRMRKEGFFCVNGTSFTILYMGSDIVRRGKHYKKYKIIAFEDQVKGSCRLCQINECRITTGYKRRIVKIRIFGSVNKGSGV